MKLAILGRTQMLYETARLFLSAGHTISLVATCKEAPEYTVTAQDFENLAKECGAAFLRGPSLSGQLEAIRQSGAQLAVSMNWPGILGEEVIGLFPHGILNAHPGDLPRYRGNACPNWAILNGEDHVSLTIHKMDAGELDSGDIILKESFSLAESTTIAQVYRWLEEAMPPLYLKAAEGLVSGAITPQPQSKNPEDILRVYPRLPIDGHISWAQPAGLIARLVRASGAPFAGAYTWLDGQKLTVWDADAHPFAVPSCAAPGQVTEIDRTSGAVSVAAGDGFVTLRSVSLPDTQPQTPAGLIASVRTRLGLNAEVEIASLKAELAALRRTLEEWQP